MIKQTYKLFSWETRNHRCRESVQSRLWKYSLILSFSHETTFHPPFSKQARILSCKRVTLPSIPLYLILCKLLSLPSPSLFPPSLHPKIPLRSATPLRPLCSPPLCLNSFGPREQTKKGLCPGRKRWCVSQWGDNASAGSTQSEAPSLSFSVCLSLINYLKFTFTDAQNTTARYSTLFNRSAYRSVLQDTITIKF